MIIIIIISCSCNVVAIIHIHISVRISTITIDAQISIIICNIYVATTNVVSCVDITGVIVVVTTAVIIVIQVIINGVIASIVQKIRYSWWLRFQHLILGNNAYDAVIISDPASVTDMEGICQIVALGRFFAIVINHRKKLIRTLSWHGVFRFG